jgi:hypothetical protein
MSANATNYPASFLQLNQTESATVNPISSTNEGNPVNILHFPSSANTGDLNADNTEWLGKTHDETFSAVTQSMDQFGYAVVTMHPMEFTARQGTQYQNKVDQAQIRELELLIDDIRGAGYRIVTISEINDGYAAVPEFSSLPIVAILAATVVVTILFSKGTSFTFWKRSA